MRFAKDLATRESVRVVLAIVNVPLGQRWAKLGGDRPSLLSTAAALILALAALVTGCERKQSDTTDRVFEFKAPIEANLLFISVDTTRADHLGCYGYSRPTSPRIDQLAASGHLFTEAYTVMPTTLPSHSSMFTSLYPAQHGVLRNGQPLSKNASTLAERLKAHGFTTAAFVGAVVLHPLFGVDQGFDTYVTPPEEEWSASRVREAACQWLRTNSNNRFFCFVHLFDPHAWYEAPEEFTRLLHAPKKRLPPERGFLKRPQALTPQLCRQSINAYDAEIRYADHEVGLLLDKLCEIGLAEQTVVVIVSDHGEAMDELITRYAFAFGHGKFLYRHQLRILFAVRLPEVFGLPGAATHHELVSTLDLLPTILDLLNVPCKEPFEGRSLTPLLAGRAVPKCPLIAQRRSVEGVRGLEELLRGEQFSVIDAPWHWIFATNRDDELFNLETDPHERASVLTRHADVAGRLERTFQAWRASSGSPLWERDAWEDDKLQAHSELVRKLRTLGYIGGINDSKESTYD